MSRMPSFSEQRRHPRYVISKPCRVTAGGRDFRCRLKDISAGGAAIKWRTRIEAGAEIEVDMGDIGAYPATVVRVQEDEGVVAVRFVLDDAAQERLTAEITKIFQGMPG